jgi:hypothetical protein
MVWFLTEAREEFEADMKQGFTVEADGGAIVYFVLQARGEGAARHGGPDSC